MQQIIQKCVTALLPVPSHDPYRTFVRAPALARRRLLSRHKGTHRHHPCRERVVFESLDKTAPVCVCTILVGSGSRYPGELVFGPGAVATAASTSTSAGCAQGGTAWLRSRGCVCLNFPDRERRSLRVLAARVRLIAALDLFTTATEAPSSPLSISSSAQTGYGGPKSTNPSSSLYPHLPELTTWGSLRRSVR